MSTLVNISLAHNTAPAVHPRFHERLLPKALVVITAIALWALSCVAAFFTSAFLLAWISGPICGLSAALIWYANSLAAGLFFGTLLSIYPIKKVSEKILKTD